MACRDCSENWFWKKLGRCQRCMDQLTSLSVICWVVWYFGFRETPSSIGSIALLFAGFACNALLFLHLWMKFVVLPYKQRKRREHPSQDIKKPQD